MQATRDCILGYVNDLTREDGHVGTKESDAAVIIDGKTLKFALSCDLRRDFLDLCTSCRAVICCRASPIQKAEVILWCYFFVLSGFLIAAVLNRLLRL